MKQFSTWENLNFSPPSRISFMFWNLTGTISANDKPSSNPIHHWKIARRVRRTCNHENRPKSVPMTSWRWSWKRFKYMSMLLYSLWVLVLLLSQTTRSLLVWYEQQSYERTYVVVASCFCRLPQTSVGKLCLGIYLTFLESAGGLMKTLDWKGVSTEEAKKTTHCKIRWSIMHLIFDFYFVGVIFNRGNF